jgi:O-antigen/teichoic acid export membrane protein
MKPAAPAAVPDRGGHIEKLARRGTASLVGAGFSATFGILVVLIVTHGFSATTAGTLFSATSVFLILEAVALLGTDTGLVKWLPAHLASGRSADVRRTLVIAAVPVLGVSVVLAAALYAVAPTLSPHLVGSEAAPLMTGILRVLAVALPVATLHDLVVAATRGAGSMRPTVLVENIGRLGLQALAILVAYLAGGGTVALALAWSVPYLVGLVAASGWLRALVAERTTAGDAPAPWGTLAREFWSYTSPRAVAGITQTALKRSDIVLVAALASPAAAALYTAATRFIVLGQLFVQSVQQALSPQIAALFARGNTRSANSVYQAATLWSVTAAWPLYLVLAGFASMVMTVFGDQYAAASDVVVILSLAMLLATACGPVDSVLLMAGRSGLSLRNSTVALAIDVGLNLILIPRFGIRGAAMAWAVAIVARNMMPLVQVRRHLGLWPITRATVRVALGAVACFGVAGLITAPTDFPPPTDLLVLAVALVAYLLWLRSIRASLGLEAFRSVLRRRTGSASAPGLAPEA